MYMQSKKANRLETERRDAETASDRWLNEGGRDLRRRVGDRSSSPSLPSGYQAQLVWAFHDRTGRFFYEFSRVYGPPDLHDQRGPVCQLDEDLSYWSVTWQENSETAGGHPADRWMTYAQARKELGSPLAFERFSSLLEMRDQLPALLQERDIAPSPRTQSRGNGRVVGNFREAYTN